LLPMWLYGSIPMRVCFVILCIMFDDDAGQFTYTTPHHFLVYEFGFLLGGYAAADICVTAEEC
jgi:hypothetical protein